MTPERGAPQVVTMKRFLGSDGGACGPGSARVARWRTVQPGDSTWFPLLRNTRQRFSTVTGGEAESIYAEVAVRFNEAHSLPNCFLYAPPRLSVALYGVSH